LAASFSNGSISRALAFSASIRTASLRVWDRGMAGIDRLRGSEACSSPVKFKTS
jgi:hypothetical protein